MPKVSTYGETPRSEWLGCCLFFAFLIGVPVAAGCLFYIFTDAPRLEAMWFGVLFVIVPILIQMVRGMLATERMRQALGKPLDSGDRVQVVSGPLEGKTGTVECPGQGGPLTLFVKMDDASEDESIVFNWHHLRRVEAESIQR